MAKELSVIRVALIGPECTAKSSLSKALALHYNTLYIEEYSREYIASLDRAYLLEDILVIAQEQLIQELTAIPNANKLIFVDTELIVSKVWCEDVFQITPKWFKERLAPLKYDLYLLTYPDIPWVADSVRENGHRRDYFYNWYQRELQAINATYKVVTGDGNNRLNNCIAFIEDFMRAQKK